MHEIETWAPGSAACALCVINISSHETGRPAGRGGGGPGPHGPPLDPPLNRSVVSSCNLYYRHSSACAVWLATQAARRMARARGDDVIQIGLGLGSYLYYYYYYYCFTVQKTRGVQWKNNMVTRDSCTDGLVSRN